MQQLREYMRSAVFFEEQLTSSPTADRISVPSNR